MNELWENNISQAAALEFVSFCDCKHILGCTSKTCTCNEAVKIWLLIPYRAIRIAPVVYYTRG